MMTDGQIAAAKDRLEGAFRPLICKAEDWDYKAKMRFKVLDENDNTIFEAPEIVKSVIVDESRFADVIEKARGVVQAKGHVLA